MRLKVGLPAPGHLSPVGPQPEGLLDKGLEVGEVGEGCGGDGGAVPDLLLHLGVHLLLHLGPGGEAVEVEEDSGGGGGEAVREQGEAEGGDVFEGERGPGEEVGEEVELVWAQPGKGARCRVQGARCRVRGEPGAG